MATATRKIDPSNEPVHSRLRVGVATDAVEYDQEGGKFGAGVLRGVSLISTGEALGHEMWVDEVTVLQVAELSQDSNGVRSRFTHPSMSSDGLGRHLGRIYDVEVSDDGQQAIGDLHFAQSATKTPDGDLRAYVTELATEDPQAGGLSIVFDHDVEQEDDFIAHHSTDQFASPDKLNTNNYPHVRLHKLVAADVVDEPAANPEGFFDRQPEVRSVDAFLSYAMQLTDDKPDNCFGVDGERARQFLSRWLARNSLSVTDTPTEKPMADEVTSEPTATELANDSASIKEAFQQELAKFREAFGAEGIEYFQEGIDFAAASLKHSEKVQKENVALQARVEELESQLSQVKLGEAEPVALQSGDKTAKPTLESMTRYVNDPAKN